jgi:FkbM family methyltransferase
LRESLRANKFGNVTVLEKAVGSTRGTIQFSDNPNSELSKVAETADSTTREVALESIDALYNEGMLANISFIKIDAEGFEAEVIRGMDRFLREQDPVVMIEVSEAPVKPPMMLEALGYQQYRYCEGIGCLIPFIPNKLGDRVLNLFMCKPKRAKQLATEGLLVTWDQVKANPAPADPFLFMEKFRGLAIVRALPDVAALADAPGVSPEFHQAMSEFVMSQDAGQPLEDRAVRLARAAAYIDRAYNESVTLSELLTYCRVWEAAGRIFLIAGSLRAVIQHPAHPAFQQLTTAFLPCSGEWDGKAPRGGNVHEWLKTMVLIQYEKVHAYSSYYDGGMTADTYRFLRETGQTTEWFERRAVLRGFGDPGPNHPDPVFIGNEGTRNREIWQEIRERMKTEPQITHLRHCVQLDDS